MEVIIVNDYAWINGGAAKVALWSARELAKRGHPVRLFAGVGPAMDQLAKYGISTTLLNQTPYNSGSGVLESMFRGIWNRTAARRFREVLEKLDPGDTIVHFHTFRDVLSSSVVHVASRMGFATIYTAHEYTLGCQYGGFFNFRKRRICGLKGLSPRCIASHCNTGCYAKKLWNCGNQFVYAKIARVPASFNHVLFLSQTSRNILQPYLPESLRISTFPNPFDPMRGRPASIGPASPFLFVGSFAPHKDPVTAAKAARKIGAPIVFVGAGRLEDEIRRANPEAGITGWLDRDAVADQMIGARAFVFPSIWHESQPLSVMEAAASGLSIIAADASAVKEQLELLGVGELYRAGDVDDLAAKMEPYLNDRYAQERGLAAFEAFRGLGLSEARHVDRLLEIYEAELAPRRR